MQNSTAALSRGDHPVDSDPDANEALRRVRVSTVCSAPATVAACQADYAAGAEVRATFAKQHARHR